MYEKMADAEEELEEFEKEAANEVFKHFRTSETRTNSSLLLTNSVGRRWCRSCPGLNSSIGMDSCDSMRMERKEIVYF